MKRMHRGLMQKYEELEQFHHKALHELADAAQIIKSYEYLEKRHKRERELLERVLVHADSLLNAKDFESFKKRRAELLQTIQEYKALKYSSRIRKSSLPLTI